MFISDAPTHVLALEFSKDVRAFSCMLRISGGRDNPPASRKFGLKVALEETLTTEEFKVILGEAVLALLSVKDVRAAYVEHSPFLETLLPHEEPAGKTVDSAVG